MSTISHRTRVPALAMSTIALIMTLGVACAGATPIANKFTLSRQIGWEVNNTTHGNVCTVASKNTCGFGKESSEPGGFSDPRSIAVDNYPASPDYEDVYVGDRINHRVQELTSTGEFVRMFGKDVNETTGGDTCTAEEIKTQSVKCKAGVLGSEPDALTVPEDVAVDPSTGNVYIIDTGSGRVDEYTSTGQFVLMIGKEVNKTNKSNLCTEKEIKESGVKCKNGVEIIGSTEHGAFDFNHPDVGAGDLLTVGGPEFLLYVGEEDRVQEFNAQGVWKGEITLPFPVGAIAVDSSGDLFASAYSGVVVHELHPDGVQYAEFEVLPKSVPNRIKVESFLIKGLAVDPYGRIGFVANEEIQVSKAGGGSEKYERSYGALYSASGVLISEIARPSGEIPFPYDPGIAFSASDELYIISEAPHEIEAYVPALFPEVGACPAEDLTATSAILCGQINANGLLTRAFFDYHPLFGSKTPVAFEGKGTVFEPVHWPLTGLEPNETYGYQVLAEAELAGEPVKGLSEELTFHTPTPPVAIVGEPSASFIGASSAVLSASLNPEHASTHYHFEYERCNGAGECAAPQATLTEESSQYGVIGTTQELTGLQPQTTYRYWLVADNEHEEAGKPQGGQATGTEGSLTTGSLPVPLAATGFASAVTATSASIAGTVDPDGQPATYRFELGVYAGGATRFGIVFSGSAGAGTTPVTETLGLTGLQPGTTYAYRIGIASGYGTQTGEMALFTTSGIPGVLVSPGSLAMLAIPAIGFPPETAARPPTQTVPKCKKGETSKRGRCVRAKGRKKGPAKAKKTSRSHKAHR